MSASFSLACAAKANGDAKSEEKQLDSFLHADRADKIPPIHELVRLLIRQQKGALSVLTESKMAEYVDEYVNKKVRQFAARRFLACVHLLCAEPALSLPVSQDLDSISEGVAQSIKQMATSMKKEPGLVGKEDVKIDDVERLIRKKHTEMTAAGQAREQGDGDTREAVHDCSLLFVCCSSDRKNEEKHAEEAKQLAEMVSARCPAPWFFVFASSADASSFLLSCSSASIWI